MRKIFILIIVLFTISCKDSKPKPYEPVFTKIPKMSGKFRLGWNSETNEQTYRSREYYLIETSQDYRSKKVKDIALKFYIDNNNLCKSNSGISYYSFYIIEKNECTVKYLRPIGSIDGCYEDEEREGRNYETILHFFYERDAKNPYMWVLDKGMSDEIYKNMVKDTIYCSQF